MLSAVKLICKITKRTHRGTGAGLEGWFKPACRPDALSTQPSLLPSFTSPPSLSRLHCFFYFKLNKRLFTHPRGLKNAWALRRNGLVTYDSWTVFWGKKGCEAFFFVNQASESCKEGIQYRVSLFAYFTWRQSSDDLRSPWETVGSHRNAHKKKKKCLSLQPCALKADACCDLLTV